MVAVELNDDDKARTKKAVDVVLTRWAKRCGSKCAGEWNDTIGKVLGAKAPTN